MLTILEFKFNNKKSYGEEHNEWNKQKNTKENQQPTWSIKRMNLKRKKKSETEDTFEIIQIRKKTTKKMNKESLCGLYVIKQYLHYGGPEGEDRQTDRKGQKSDLNSHRL